MEEKQRRLLERIGEIEARAAKATPGPWQADGQFVRPSHGSPQYAECGHLEKSWNEETFANAQFVAHAREDVPWLCETVRQLVARLEEVEAQNAAMLKRIRKLEEALIWCSAATDFAPEGKAREGFEKLVLPLLNQVGRWTDMGTQKKG